MLTAIGRIREYTRDLDREAFLRDARTIDAVVRNLEVIGEATKKIPVELRACAPDVEWRKIMGMRDLIAHVYFDIDLNAVWDVVTTKLDSLEAGVRRLRGN